jgi:hypothetical protein
MEEMRCKRVAAINKEEEDAGRRKQRNEEKKKEGAEWGYFWKIRKVKVNWAVDQPIDPSPFQPKIC